MCNVCGKRKTGKLENSKTRKPKPEPLHTQHIVPCTTRVPAFKIVSETKMVHVEVLDKFLADRKDLLQFNSQTKGQKVAQVTRPLGLPC